MAESKPLWSPVWNNAPDLCLTCGAYWSCEHRQTVEDYIAEVAKHPAWKPKLVIHPDTHVPGVLEGIRKDNPIESLKESMRDLLDNN